eukprot:TRINITY_DN6744_c0_g1_i1.p1 TRINITY_DN6744_c0_g1~~TRINITY_DN6744_c0_g1_i1.p1  ORF type:complete len:643 (+),score=203.61 TRINITY_DN6744_c0_g1_i1:6-1934(+)
MSERKGLTNEDFKKILLTPRAPPENAEPPTPSRFSHLDPNSKNTPRASSDKKRRHYKKKQQHEDKSNTKYRDRADERRKGINIDYGDTELMAPTGFHAVGPEIEKQTTAEKQKQEIERSKFLGGDMEHTHLVKGLDYSLLAKVKSEMAKEEREKIREEERNKSNEPAKVINALDDAETPEKFSTHMGRSIFHMMFRNERPPTVDNFLPGRTLFVYDLDPEVNQEIPTTVKRSKDSCPDASQFIVAQTHPEIMNRISKIMIYYTQGAKAYRKMKKKQKRDKELAEQAELLKKQQNSEDLNVDIFDDVDDDYVPSSSAPVDSKDIKVGKLLSVNTKLDHLKVDKPQAKVEVPKPVSSADNVVGPQRPDAMSAAMMYPEANTVSTKSDSLPPVVGPQRPSHMTPTAEVVGPQRPDTNQMTTMKYPEAKKVPEPDEDMMDIDEPIEKKVKEPIDLKDKEAQKKFQTDDSYSECYPGTYEGISYAAYDSEEEEDLTKMDSKKRLKRWDFETDEAYEQYEQKREALPKAAFQFGVKVKDGRKQSKRQDAKLNQKIKAVEGLLESRGDSRMKKAREDTDGDSDSYHRSEKSHRDQDSYASKLQQKRKISSFDEPPTPDRGGKKSRIDNVVDKKSEGPTYNKMMDNRLFK